MKTEVAEQIRKIITENQNENNPASKDSAVVFVSLNDEKSLSIAMGGNADLVFQAFAQLAKNSPEIAEVIGDGINAGLAAAGKGPLDAAMRRLLNAVSDDPCDCEDCRKANETPATDEELAMAMASITQQRGKA